MPMPSVEDLQTMYGAWNPQAYLQAQDNAGLERSFREQQYSQEQEKAKQASLDTLFRQQDDPARVQERLLTNRGKELQNTSTDQSNQSAALKLEREKALQNLNLDADKRQALLKITEDQLKEADFAVENMRRSLDPMVQAKGEKLYQLTGAARALQQKHKEEMEKVTTQTNATIKGHEISAGATRYAADKGAESRLAIAQLKANAANKAADIRQQVLSGKLTYEKAATLLHGAAAFETDPDLKATYERLATEFGQEKLNVPTTGNKPELAGMGIPATPAPTTHLGSGANPQRGTAANPIVLK